MPSRPRVSAAVLRDGGRDILMVQHQRRDGTTYWQLPGGGILPGENPEAAVLRELREETGLAGLVVRLLFAIPYKYGSSTTFLVGADNSAQAALGNDPEDDGSDHRKLTAVGWFPLTAVGGNPEIDELLRVFRGERTGS
jgi:8-oxo-dGTP diphosphatase